MKNLKLIVKAFFFSTFLAIVILTTNNAAIPNENVTESFLSTCCEEYPNLSSCDGGH